MQDSAPMSSSSSLCPTRRNWTLYVVAASYALSSGLTSRHRALRSLVGAPYRGWGPTCCLVGELQARAMGPFALVFYLPRVSLNCRCIRIPHTLIEPAPRYVRIAAVVFESPPSCLNRRPCPPLARFTHTAPAAAARLAPTLFLAPPPPYISSLLRYWVWSWSLRLAVVTDFATRCRWALGAIDGRQVRCLASAVPSVRYQWGRVQ